MEKCMSAILLAGGSGKRFGGETNKVLLLRNGKALLSSSLEVFLAHPAVAEVILVYRKEDETAIRTLLSAYRTAEKPILTVSGGETRQASVYAGLKAASCPFVAVQDSARPRMRARYLDECLEALKTYPGAAVAVPAKDTIKLTDKNGVVQATTERSRTFLVQTPQCFWREELLAAHQKYMGSPDATDDCMLLEKEGLAVKLVPGDYDNIKLTTPEDAKLLGMEF